jgi:RND family efflux transporter MFP subunit
LEHLARERGWSGIWLLLPVLAVAVWSCKPDTKAEAPDVRPVRTVTVAMQEAGETVALTGHIQAQDEVSLAFRIPGRMTERLVNVGDKVEPGQVLARLDPQDEENALRSARANLAAAQAQLSHARYAYQRQQDLLAQGFTTRALYDTAQRDLRSAQSQVDDAEAQLRMASDRVSFTVLEADGGGTVTARGAEPGEVVQAGQMIVQLARQGGRDAVFDVPAQLLRSAPSNPLVTIRLTDDPAVTVVGRVREVAPQADPVTRTFEVRVSLTDPPAAMRLGSTVTGSIQLESEAVIATPASALTSTQQQPAVWIVDPSNLTVSTRTVDLLRYDPGTVVIAHGLDIGDIVVTAGIQSLHPGQKVRLLGSPQ